MISFYVVGMRREDRLEVVTFELIFSFNFIKFIGVIMVNKIT